ncbi:MAG: hypothetical protein KatS3mg107_0883 [Gemmataceae bacterium]|jgi:hypothetical protein|nr:MAG: hypothetical protein KatS3mg107_0883 [Gemmataceae bacterium]
MNSPAAGTPRASHAEIVYVEYEEDKEIMNPPATQDMPKITRSQLSPGYPSMRGWHYALLMGTLITGLSVAVFSFVRFTSTDSRPAAATPTSSNDLLRGNPSATPSSESTPTGQNPALSPPRSTRTDQNPALPSKDTLPAHNPPAPPEDIPTGHNPPISAEAQEPGSAGRETSPPGTQEDKPESLPEYPKLDPQNTLTALNPEKTLFAEIGVVDGKKKVIRVGLVCEVCLREGPLEVFLCKKGTKEHEAIVRVDADAQFLHAALEAAGAKPGKPTQFVNPTTEQPEYKPATGDKIKVLVHYRHRGQTRTHPAQEWIWDRNKKMALPYDWVFAGSVTIVDPDTGRKFYGANSGDIISISNFPYSLLEIPAEISKDDANLTYEARTAQIPPLWSKVWVILQPASPDRSGR